MFFGFLMLLVAVLVDVAFSRREACVSQVALHDEGIDTPVDLVAGRGMSQPVRRSGIDLPGEIWGVGGDAVRCPATHLFDNRVDCSIRKWPTSAGKVHHQWIIASVGG